MRSACYRLEGCHKKGEQVLRSGNTRYNPNAMDFSINFQREMSVQEAVKHKCGVAGERGTWGGEGGGSALTDLAGFTKPPKSCSSTQLT